MGTLFDLDVLHLGTLGSRPSCSMHIILSYFTLCYSVVYLNTTWSFASMGFQTLKRMTHHLPPTTQDCWFQYHLLSNLFKYTSVCLTHGASTLKSVIHPALPTTQGWSPSNPPSPPLPPHTHTTWDSTDPSIIFFLIFSSLFKYTSVCLTHGASTLKRVIHLQQLKALLSPVNGSVVIFCFCCSILLLYWYPIVKV